MPRLIATALVLALVAAMANALTMYGVADVGYLGAMVVDYVCDNPPQFCYSETVYMVFFNWGAFRLNMDRAYIWTSEPLGAYIGTGKPLCFVGDIINDVFYAYFITDRLWFCYRIWRYW